MYTTHTAADFREFLDLADDYTVEGLLACGTWDLLAIKRDLPNLRSALDAKQLSYSLERFENTIIGHGYELLIDSKRYWFVPVMGTAVMSQYIHMASLLGSKRNVLLGVVGGLAPGMRSADYVVPTSVQGNDNARMYDRQNATNLYAPDDTMLELLRTKLPANQKIWEGMTTTCEIMLAETQHDVDTWSEAGLLGVEMEAALFFSASKFFSIPAVALLYVADNLIENQTMLSEEHRKTSTERDDVRKKQYEIGLELMMGS